MIPKSKPSNRTKFQKFLSTFSIVISFVSIFLAGVAIAFGWGIEWLSLFTISAYFFGLTYAILPSFFSSFGSKLFGASFLALFTAPTIVYSIVIVIILINKNNQLLKVADSSTWILFAGSVIGGLMTMLAVYFSIKSSENTTKQQIEKINEQLSDSRAQFEKQLEIYSINERNRLFPYFKCKFKRDQYNHSKYFDFDIVNISPYPIRNLVIKNTSEVYGNISLVVVSKTINFLPPNEVQSFNVDVDSSRVGRFEHKLKITIEFQYYDLLLNGPYLHITHIDFGLVTIEKETFAKIENYLTSREHSFEETTSLIETSEDSYKLK